MDPLTHLVTLIQEVTGTPEAPKLSERHVESITGIHRNTLKRRLVKPADFKWDELEAIARLTGRDLETLIANAHGREVSA